MERKVTRHNPETGVYRVTSESNEGSSDQIIEEIAARLLSDDCIDGCPLFSWTWGTCVFDQLLEMLDDYVLIDYSIVRAHEQTLRTRWNKGAVKRALAKCGDSDRCSFE